MLNLAFWVVYMKCWYLSAIKVIWFIRFETKVFETVNGNSDSLNQKNCIFAQKNQIKKITQILAEKKFGLKNILRCLSKSGDWCWSKYLRERKKREQTCQDQYVRKPEAEPKMILRELCKLSIKSGTGEYRNVIFLMKFQNFQTKWMFDCFQYGFSRFSGRRSGWQLAIPQWKSTNGCQYRVVNKRKNISKTLQPF